MEANPAPRWQRRPDARPEELVEAAVEVFGEVGFAKAKLEDVAKRAGVSKGTVYLYFESKEALFREMIRIKVRRTFEDPENRFQDESVSARELMSRFLRHWWSISRTSNSACMSRIIHSEISNFPELARFLVDEVIGRNRARLRWIYQHGVKRGEFRELPYEASLRSISSMIVHSALYQRFFAPHDPEALQDDEVIDGIIDLVFNGIAIPAAESK